MTSSSISLTGLKKPKDKVFYDVDEPINKQC